MFLKTGKKKNPKWTALSEPFTYEELALQRQSGSLQHPAVAFGRFFPKRGQGRPRHIGGGGRGLRTVVNYLHPGHLDSLYDRACRTVTNSMLQNVNGWYDLCGKNKPPANPHVGT